MNILMPTCDEIHAAFSEGEEAIVDLFEAVGKQVECLASQLEKQNEVPINFLNRFLNIDLLHF